MRVSVAYLGGAPVSFNETLRGTTRFDTGADADVLIGQDANDPTTNIISLNGVLADPGFLGLLGGAAADPNLYIQTGAGGSIQFFPDATNGGAGFVVFASALAQIVMNLQVTGNARADTFSVGAVPGIDAAITTASLVGKTATFNKGILTGFV